MNSTAQTDEAKCVQQHKQQVQAQERLQSNAEGAYDQGIFGMRGVSIWGDLPHCTFDHTSELSRLHLTGVSNAQRSKLVKLKLRLRMTMTFRAACACKMTLRVFK